MLRGQNASWFGGRCPARAGSRMVGSLDRHPWNCQLVHHPGGFPEYLAQADACVQDRKQMGREVFLTSCHCTHGSSDLTGSNKGNVAPSPTLLSGCSVFDAACFCSISQSVRRCRPKDQMVAGGRRIGLRVGCHCRSFWSDARNFKRRCSEHSGGEPLVHSWPDTDSLAAFLCRFIFNGLSLVDRRLPAICWACPGCRL